MRPIAASAIALVLPFSVLACGSGSAKQPSASPAPSATNPTTKPTSGPSTTPAAAKGPDALVASYGGRSIEVACNGLDDDGDGQVDVLLPVGPNACATGKKGACESGFAVCEDGKRTCIAPVPMPEVVDGIDNDCNGTVDDVAEGSVKPRALLLAPRYAWTDAAPDVANVTSAFAQAGIPFDRPANGSNWASIDALDRYSLVVIPGYLLASVLAPVREKLEAFVQKGGVLVVFKPVGDENKRPEAYDLTGLRNGTRHRDVEDVRFTPASSAATWFVDSTEERSVGINPKGEKEGVEVWTFDPQPYTEVLAAAYAGGAPAGAVVTRRPLGKGAVYAVGHDLATFGAGGHCYLNCFESAGDVMRLLFEGAFREGSRGHTARLATAPSGSSSVLVLTHDVNTREGLFSGGWGEAGAIQLAKMEKERGVHATFNVLADYRGNVWSPATVRELCALGMCPAGIQGIARVPQFARMKDGMVKISEKEWKCPETLAGYSTPSLCGEVMLSAQLVQSAGSRAPRVWRSPYLAYHPALFQILAGSGIQFDTTFGIGDLPYNVPLDLATTGVQPRRFQRRPLLELPLGLDDSLEIKTGDKKERIELQPSTEARFRSVWEYVITQNRRNGSFTTLRVNANRGEGTSPDNLQAKTMILGRFLDELARSQPDIAVQSVDEVGTYWRARLDAKLDVSFDETAYKGSITIGKSTAPGLTIELGDAIKSFECAKCGKTKTSGRHVVLLDALPPGTKADFTATVR